MHAKQTGPMAVTSSAHLLPEGPTWRSRRLAPGGAESLSPHARSGGLLANAARTQLALWPSDKRNACQVVAALAS